MPNLNTRLGIPFGVHQCNAHSLFMELADDIMQQGTDCTHEEMCDDLRTKVRNWLEDIDTDDGGLVQQVSDALQAADVISSYRNEQDRRLIQDVAEVYQDNEGEWDWDQVMDLVLNHVNDSWAYDEPHTYTHTIEGVQLMLSPLGGAQLLWVMDSTHATYCRPCSPCVPGAGDLDSPDDEDSGCLALCLPPEWFTDAEEPCPYRTTIAVDDQD